VVCSSSGNNSKMSKDISEWSLVRQDSKRVVAVLLATVRLEESEALALSIRAR